MTAVRTFAQTLRKYTTVRAVLQNYTQINQMLTDLNHVDFRNIQEQVGDYDIFVFLNFFKNIYEIYSLIIKSLFLPM